MSTMLTCTPDLASMVARVPPPQPINSTRAAPAWRSRPYIAWM